VLLIALLISGLTWAQTPELIPVRVAFVPIDDASYHTVVLVDDGKPCPTPHEVQGPTAHYGFVMNQFKNPQGAWVEAMGCWDSDADATVKVEYMDASTSILWHHFTFRMAEARRMTWDWRRDRFTPADTSHPTNQSAAPAAPPSESLILAKSMSPSFDCTKARSVSERLICADPELAAQDFLYAKHFQRALAKTPERELFLRESREHLKEREAHCFDKTCLLEWYAERGGALSAVVQ